MMISKINSNNSIIILDENTANKIAAGEVVERPASVVKELVENSIDAGATSISIDIRDGGITYLRISDNGCGMEPVDALMAFERHATSKIRIADDLEHITSMGFRGEALASIAAVSKVELITRTEKSLSGVKVEITAGEIHSSNPIGSAVGTTIIVSDLFFNTPARYKFLKRNSTEAGYIYDIVSKLALGRPDISFKYTNGKDLMLHTPGNGDLLSSIYCVYGNNIASNCLKAGYTDDVIRVHGYIGKPEIARGTRNGQSVFLNNRYIRNRTVTAAVDDAVKTLIMKGKFAFFVLCIDINTELVDVNVHPTKMEVKFADERIIYTAIRNAVTNALSGAPLLRDAIQMSKAMQNPPDISETDIKIEEHHSGGSFGFHHILTEGSTGAEVHDENGNRKIVADPEPFHGARNADSRESACKEHIQSDNECIQNNEECLQDNEECLQNNEEYIRNDKEFIRSDNSLPPKKFFSEIVKPAQSSILPDMNFYDSDPDNNNSNNMKKSGGLLIADIVKNSIYLCQIFETFLVLQHRDSVILVDQHAAHERILYEKLADRFGTENTKYHNQVSQVLLEGEIIEVTPIKLKTSMEYAETLNRLGYSFDVFGTSEVIIRQIPALGHYYDFRAAFIDLLDILPENDPGFNGITDMNDVNNEKIYTLACRAAIKANKRLVESEVTALLDSLKELNNPYTCTHGRPVLLRIERKDIEKLFKRIV